MILFVRAVSLGVVLYFVLTHKLLRTRTARMTVKVTLDGHVLAESDKTIVVEGNHYFPPESVKIAEFTQSTTHTTCPWKGEASYYNISVSRKEIKDVAWYYPSTITKRAKPIEGYVAFYKNKVTIESDLSTTS